MNPIAHPHRREVTPVASPAQYDFPSKLFVEVTTRCNLSCPMCCKQSTGCGIAEGEMTGDIFDRITPSFSRLEALILNGIGEPLLHPSLERFIAVAKAKLPAGAWVGFQTNGQLLTPRRAHALVAAGVDKVCVSADAVTPDIFRAMRTGGERAAVETGIAALRAAARRMGRPLSLGIEFVVTRHNIGELSPLVRWAARHTIDFVIVSHLLPYHDGQVDAAAFDTNTDRAQEIFGQWQAAAERRGIDLNNYFDIFMKFQKTPEQQGLVDYVNCMKAEALQRGITLHVERLLKRDREMLGRVQDAFAEAEQIAAAKGIALRLPSRVPTQTRRCEFIEAGAAFISWDGRVHPCYFLWHQYRCYIGGLAKHVQPLSFGRVTGQPLLSIWNAPEFAAFRQAVRRYDFPFCYDCSMALCDYVEMAEFEQDCHISAVPCGACLWCTGLFHCLQ
ncbi:MAG: radical SAM/SPASM family putative metalloenzyme maturase [Desulfosarcinaceae bacterium]|nr:radical SAM/SPASM family putative metalloenzyme maturase [Desulfosarcinaceae bacterium]